MRAVKQHANLYDKPLSLQGFNLPITFRYSDDENCQSRLVRQARSMWFLLQRAFYFCSLLTLGRCLYCSGPPPQVGWMVGPDRYYRAFGLDGGELWDEADRRCRQHQSYDYQLAVPHSFDDAHFMKAHVVTGAAFWVGKVFESL